MKIVQHQIKLDEENLQPELPLTIYIPIEIMMDNTVKVGHEASIEIMSEMIKQEMIKHFTDRIVKTEIE